ncbi:tannase/feruloyl esterase family alpha/beta hydrolase [Silvibacterium acidisoli]|uniref:tannase/feruloyl esterase family alpha/beta hydrolase n=1 Tax=Acidobacteriaceae bacterium ZG23-2 TaxID=2883246 RepID=UPI00406C95AF
MRRVLLCLLSAVSLCATGYAQQAASCSSLATLHLPHAAVLEAKEFPTGSFGKELAQTNPQAAALFAKLPPFCRVTVESTPTPDSKIAIEVWMPLQHWNGKFRGQGNGGFAGSMAYTWLAYSVMEGYATAATDAGHKGDSTDASWALGHPEKVIDFGHRGVHEMTTTAKSVLDAYYGKAASRSYFLACSDGGREALMEAQRYPADYDGIIAGAPAYNWTNLLSGGMTKTQALMRTPESFIPASKIPAIHAAVNAACDKADGIADGILNDPRQCHFDPEVLLCKGDPSDACLTRPQVDTLKSLYSATVDASGKELYPAHLPGAEDGPGGWGPWVVGSEPGKSLGFAFGVNYFKYMVYEDPNWDYKTFQLADGLKQAVEKTGDAVDATNPDLSAFAARGGKLILYHGWNDPAISPLGTLDYYQKAEAANPHAGSFLRLFMVPGMQHCTGGDGPSSFGQVGWVPGTGPKDATHNMAQALEDWVENGKAPEQVIAAKIETEGMGSPRITMTRPLCAYPKEAHYKGSGDESDAANFTCALPKK